MVACAGVIVLAGGPFFYGFSVFVDPLLREFGWSSLAVAAAFSFRSEVSAIAAPLAGVLLDRLGPRAVMTAGVVIVAAGLFLLSRVDSLWSFYATVCLVSVGTNFCSSQSSSIVISRWFRRRRSRALTFVTVGGAISGLTVPALAWSVSELGWRTALVWWASGSLVVCLLLSSLIRNSPSDLGLLPDGEAPGETRETGQARAPTLHARVPGLRLGEAVRTRGFWLLALAMGLSNFATTPPFVLLIPALTRSGITPETASLAAAAIPLVSLPGRLLFGFRGDYDDKRKLMALAFGLQAAGVALLTVVDSPLSLAAFVVVFGTGFGGPLPLRTAIQADLFGLSSLGSIQGMVNLVTTLGGFLGPVLAGWLVDVTGSYRPGFLAAAGAAALAVPLALAIRAPSRPSPE